jgi:ATP-dependent DNA helicase RecG
VKGPIEKLLAGGETERVEFKSASAREQTVAAAVCGMLNQQGGTVLWGVDDAGRIEPMAHPSEKAARLRAYLQEHLRPQAFLGVAVEATAKGAFVSVEVPPGADKPYACAGTIYVRVGAATMRARAEDAEELVRDNWQTPERWERRAASSLSLADLDPEELAATAKDIRDRQRLSLPEAADAEAILETLGLRQSAQFTNAALVLFANQPGRWLPHARVRVTRYAARKGGALLADEWFEGPAIRVLREVFAWVGKNTGTASHFPAGQLQRADQPHYPAAALREGLVNALVHRDYENPSGGVTVGLYADHLVIWNVGRLPDGWTAMTLKRGHTSIPRNPDIAHVFYLRGYMENLGIGTQRILAECKRAGVPEPEWKSDAQGVTLTIHASTAVLVEERLTQRQRDFLAKVPPGESMSSSAYEKACEVSERQARRDLAALAQAGWFARVGQGRATVYLRTDRPLTGP